MAKKADAATMPIYRLPNEGEKYDFYRKALSTECPGQRNKHGHRLNRIVSRFGKYGSPRQHYNRSSYGSWRAVFYQTGTRTARPTCSVTDRWVISTNNAAGQAMASALLTAWSLHKQISVIGSGVCDIWGDTETVSYFVIID
jgi:hypothetical protein